MRTKIGPAALVAALVLPSLAVVSPLLGQPSPGADPKQPTTPTPVSYYKDIRPILQLHCQGCHQPAKAQGGYVMVNHADLFKAGERGKPGIVVGKPDESELYDQIIPHGNKRAEMPRGRDPLTETQTRLIRQWIIEGAKDDTPASAKAVVVDAEHPPVYAALPVISALAYSPDSQLIAVGGFHEILLHKADGSGLVARLIGLSERIQSLAFSPDGQLLAATGGAPGRFGEVQVWDVAKEKLRISIAVTADTTFGASWSPDGKMVAFGCTDNSVRAIEIPSGKQVLYQGGHNDWVLNTTFSVDGQFLVSVSRDRSMKLTEVSTQRLIDNITSITPGALKGGISALARRPLTEKKIVKITNLEVNSIGEKIYDELVVGGSDGTPRLYKMHRTEKRQIGDDSNRLREFAKMPGRVYAVACSPDAKRFAAGSSLDGKGEVRIYEIDSGKQLLKCDGEPGAVYALAWRPDGNELAVAGFDGLVRFYNPNDGKLIRTITPVPAESLRASR